MCEDGSVGAGAWGWEQFFLRIYFQNSFYVMIQNHSIFHIGMEARAREMIICFKVCFQTTYFFLDWSMGSWEWEHHDESVDFFLKIFFQKSFFLL